MPDVDPKPDHESQPTRFTFIDGLPEVFERAAAFLRENDALDITDVALDGNEDGDYILRLYGE